MPCSSRRDNEPDSVRFRWTTLPQARRARKAARSSRLSARAGHQINAERDRNDTDKIADFNVLAEYEKREQHAERRHQEVIGAGGGGATDVQQVKPYQIRQD